MHLLGPNIADVEMASLVPGRSLPRRPSQHKTGPGRRRLCLILPLTAAVILVPLTFHALTTPGHVAHARAAPQHPEVYQYRIVGEYPHDGKAFTQGLEYDRTCNPGGNCTEFFWESTGLHGQSSVRQVEFPSGRVLSSKLLPQEDFGEGITRLGNRLYQLTWRSPRAWVYPTDDLEAAALVSTPLTDGWGITNDGQHLVLSNSSAVLSWVDPETMALLAQRSVHDAGRPVPFINEMEWVEGSILANIWSRECIARIDPTTAHVVAWIDLRGITAGMRQSLDAEERKDLRNDVLNGIAWDAEGRRLFVTGKRWPRMYEVVLEQVGGEARDAALSALRDACIVMDTSIFDGR